jgi:ABC-type iron transport system FetAB ATPase subunit
VVGAGVDPVLRLEALRSALSGPFDLALSPGACIGITGPSGSGKSVFLRMVADLDPNEGEAFLGEAARSSLPAPAWRRKVVYVPAESGWWSERIADHFPKDELARAHALAARLRLPDGIIGEPVARLSTGERQRVALIRALALDPPVLLLDEPTSGLDAESVARVEALLRERMAEGLAILLVTHDPVQAARLAEHRYVMTSGRLEAAA